MTEPESDRASGSGRRTAVLAAVVATVALVVVVLVVATTLGGDGGEAEDPTATDGAVAPPECPPAPAEGETDPIDEPDPRAPDAVPDGATSVRLCQGPGMPVDGAGDLLTDGAQQLADAINQLETTGPPELCTADMGPGFRLVFGYSDGATFVVSGRDYGCHELIVGSGYRSPANEALAEFRELMRAQPTAPTS